MLAVKTNKLYKRFGSVVAVDGVDLNINEGELFALLGVNGAGKTTLIKTLSCLLDADSGTVEIFGLDASTESQKIKGVLNVSPQESAVAPNLTVKENLAFIAQIYGFSKKEAEKKTEEILEKFSLKEVEDRYAKNLSGGYTRRLSIGMAIITNPKLLFLDEPTLGLDVIARRSLWGVIKELKGKVTMVLTTHYLEEAESLADRIGVMAKGKLVADGSAKKLIEISGKENFEEAFVYISSPDFCEKKATFNKKEEDL